jgi:hypothetical protein
VQNASTLTRLDDIDAQLSKIWRCMDYCPGESRKGSVTTMKAKNTPWGTTAPLNYGLHSDVALRTRA